MKEEKQSWEEMRRPDCGGGARARVRASVVFFFFACFVYFLLLFFFTIAEDPVLQ